MEKRKTTIGGRDCYIYDYGSSDVLLIQPADDHDLEVLDSEAALIEQLSDGTGFTLAAFKVNDWNTELSPWEAPPVFGNEGFGGGAADTLSYITDELLPELEKDIQPELTKDILAGSTETVQSGSKKGGVAPEVTVYLGGYSLAGFFALWAGYQTDRFAGVAACSPSVWFPGWIDYSASRSTNVPHVYLSLGDKEEKTRNPVMRTVGDNIRRQLEILEADEACTACTLEMNQGNHFKEPDLRTAKGFAWLLKKEKI